MKARGTYNVSHSAHTVILMFFYLLDFFCKNGTKYEFCWIQGKHNPRAADPPIDTAKNPNFLVLISENFIEARAAFSRSGLTNLASNHSPVKMDVSSVLPVSGTQSISNSAGLFIFFRNLFSTFIIY